MRYRLDVVAPTVLDAVRFAEVRDLESVLASWEERPHPQTVAVAADLFDRDARVRQGVLEALEQGATEVTLWGEGLPAELDESVDSVQHRLSAAARAFKAQALAAANDPEADVGYTETFRCGMMASVAADLIPAS
jgi:hypothetical protein